MNTKTRISIDWLDNPRTERLHQIVATDSRLSAEYYHKDLEHNKALGRPAWSDWRPGIGHIGDPARLCLLADETVTPGEITDIALSLGLYHTEAQCE